MLDELYRSLREIYKSYFAEKENIREKLEKKNKTNDYQFYIDYIGLLDLRIDTLSGILKIFESNFLSKNISVPFYKNDYFKKIYRKEIINKRLQILDIQEKERQRIVRHLHDNSLQNLLNLFHNLEMSSLYIDEDPIKAKLELAIINSKLKTIVQEIRDTIFDLRPMTFDDLGLKDAFDRLIFKLSKSSNIKIEYNIEYIHCGNSLVLMTIFRIVEECLNNAIRHSEGSRILFELKENTDGNCLIIVSDDGIGFDSERVLSVENRHFGLCILKERVELLSGTMEIDSNPGHGTAIKIVVPILE